VTDCLDVVEVFVRLEFLPMVTMKCAVFRTATLCSMVEVCRRFEVSCCPNIGGNIFLIQRATSAILHCTTCQNRATFGRVSVWTYSEMYAFHHAIKNTGSSGSASDLRCGSCRFEIWPGLALSLDFSDFPRTFKRNPLCCLRVATTAFSTPLIFTESSRSLV
jgi:hypothetical protein